MKPVPSFPGLPLRLRRFLRDDSGVALVEFALALPMMLLVFAVLVEGSRMMLSYQATIAGVRDAARYLARVVPFDVCTTHASVAGYSAKLLTIVAQGTSGASVLPSGITITSVTPSYVCVTGSYRGGTVPVAQVDALLSMTFPLAHVFSLVGGSNLPALTTHVTEKARVFGS